jgi:DNA-binding LacI/PurR family transcriptional regulator
MNDKTVLTMKDIAERAGVSVAAVSAALGGKYRTIHVSDATRERIQILARELNYQPNVTARSLRRKHSDILGFFGRLEPRISFYAELLIGLKDGCERYNKHLLLHSESRELKYRDMVNSLTNGRIDGLIFHAPDDPELAEHLLHASIPVVTIVDAIQGIPSLVADDFGGMRMLMDHLAAKGYRKFIFKKMSSQITSLARREASYIQYCNEHGFDNIIWEVDDEDYTEQQIHNTLKLNNGIEGAVCILCWHDDCANLLIPKLLQMGLRVPQDVGVCGFDGLPASPGLSWNLTSVRAPWQQVAFLGVETLCALIENRPVEMEVKIPCVLQEGNTA